MPRPGRRSTDSPEATYDPEAAKARAMEHMNAIFEDVKVTLLGAEEKLGAALQGATEADVRESLLLDAQRLRNELHDSIEDPPGDVALLSGTVGTKPAESRDHEDEGDHEDEHSRVISRAGAPAEHGPGTLSSAATGAAQSLFAGLKSAGRSVATVVHCGRLAAPRRGVASSARSTEPVIEAMRGLQSLQAEKEDLAARLAAAEEELRIRTVAAEKEKLRTRALLAEKENTAARLAVAEQQLWTKALGAEQRKMAARPAIAEQVAVRMSGTCQEKHGKILRNIFYGEKGSRSLDVYEEIVITSPDGMLDKNGAAKKRKGALTFGDRVKLVEEMPTKSGPIWFHIQSLATKLDGWVVGQIPGKILNCVDTAEYGQNRGPIPTDAYLGQTFPDDGMYTEGYDGTHETCLVSASADNFWREVNIELLFRDMGTATVFEQGWGGDERFADWVAFYACNCAMYGKLGTENPKRYIVTVKPNANYKTYPKTCVDPEEVKAEIGRAQYKECEWLCKNLPKKGYAWENVEFMTAFQFLKRYCNWSQEDCKNAATNKASRALNKFRSLSLEQMSYEFEMLKGSFKEAFDGGNFPGILREIETFKDKAILLVEQFRDAVAKYDENGITSAARLLTQQGLIGPLTVVLKDNNLEARRYAAEALGKLGNKAACPALQAVLQDNYWAVRRYAAEALGKLGDRAARSALQAVLQDSHPNVRWHAAEALAKLGDVAALPALQAALVDTNSNVRWKVVNALGRVGGSAELQPLLQDEHWDVRESAARALGKLGDKAMSPALQEALRDFKWSVRKNAAEALGKLGDKAALPALQAALQDSDWLVRQYAAEALGRLGDGAARPALQAALQDRFPIVREEVRRALAQLQVT